MPTSTRTDSISGRQTQASTKKPTERPFYETEAFLEKFKADCAWNNQQMEEWSMDSPTNTYRSCTYWATKRFLAYPEFEGLSEYRIVEILDIVARKLAPKGHPDPWAYLLPDCDIYGGQTDPRTETISALRNLKVPESQGMDVLQIAWAKACRRPLNLPDPGASMITRKIMTLAWHLQQQSMTGFIVLPQQRIGQLANVSQELISKILRNAVAEGLLKPHRKYPPKAKRATEYICQLFEDQPY